ncbi:hypothetical protein CPB85DRAFT_1334961 [Mucidula mucida]|nr:hypothetical protein CPB85DRAFT_1334961 [Mucidula mucida]
MSVLTTDETSNIRFTAPRTSLTRADYPDREMSNSPYTGSTTSFSSSAPLNPNPPPKDFSAAFASLQSTYGFAGQAPSPSPSPSQKPKSPSSSSSLFAKLGLRSTRPSSSTTPSSQPQKEQQTKLSPELAFADLASRYPMQGGSGGGSASQSKTSSL